MIKAYFNLYYYIKNNSYSFFQDILEEIYIIFEAQSANKLKYI